MDLTPLRTLFDSTTGNDLPLPDSLSRLYGSLRFPLKTGKPHVFTNFVSTIDGVVTLAVPGHESGGDISGFNQHDHLVMGLLRSSADAVIITAGSLRVAPGHLWTGEDIFPALKDEFRKLRRSLSKDGLPLHVVVTASGALDLDIPLFQTGMVKVLILTSQKGQEDLAGKKLPEWVQVAVAPVKEFIPGHQILKILQERFPCQIILVEGGPHLVGNMFKDRSLDELFLTLSPQIAGRNGAALRYSFAEGVSFAPDDPLWGNLVSLKQAGEYLFLRYSFSSPK